jgi:hypothetical protein
LDYGGNIERFAPLSDVWDIHKSPQRVEKEEREAQKKRTRQLTHDTEASRLDPMAEAVSSLTLPVDAVYYEVVPSRNPAQRGRSLLKVTYRLRSQLHKWVTTWVCHEYTGGARFHASQWFERRKAPIPPTAQEAYRHARAGRYPMPETLVVRQEGKYLRVVVEQFPTGTLL